MHARTGLIEVPVAGLDDAIQAVREQIIPLYHDLAGYVGFTVLVDREAGQILGITYWETEEDLRSSEEAAHAARQHASDVAGRYDAGERQAWEVVAEDRV